VADEDFGQHVGRVRSRAARRSRTTAAVAAEPPDVERKRQLASLGAPGALMAAKS
jgi:hypothetical protein